MIQTTKKHLLPILLFVFVSKVFGAGINPPELPRVHGSPTEENTIRFTENKNQWDKKIVYRAQLDGGLLFLEKNCFTYNFYDKETLRERHMGQVGKENGDQKTAKDETQIRTHAFRMSFLNSQRTVETSAIQATSDYCNFFMGNDKSKWAGNVKNYTEVNYKSLY